MNVRAYAQIPLSHLGERAGERGEEEEDSLSPLGERAGERGVGRS
jgi:hypothetical protein